MKSGGGPRAGGGQDDAEGPVCRRSCSCSEAVALGSGTSGNGALDDGGVVGARRHLAAVRLHDLAGDARCGVEDLSRLLSHATTLEDNDTTDDTMKLVLDDLAAIAAALYRR